MKNILIAAVILLSLSTIACGGSLPRLPVDGSTDPKPTPTPVATPTPTPCINCSGTVFAGDSIFGRLSINNTFENSGYINGGMFGYRTDQLLALFPDIVSGAKICHGYQPNDPSFPIQCVNLPQQPATIVLLIGWNNMFQSVGLNTMALDIQSMVNMAQAKGIKVIVCTIYAWDPGLPASWMNPSNVPVTFYDQWRVPLNNNIKSMQNVTIVDLSALFAGQTFYTIDGIHPNDYGNSQMLNAIMSNL